MRDVGRPSFWVFTAVSLALMMSAPDSATTSIGISNTLATSAPGETGLVMAVEKDYGLVGKLAMARTSQIFGTYIICKPIRPAIAAETTLRGHTNGLVGTTAMVQIDIVKKGWAGGWGVAPKVTAVDKVATASTDASTQMTLSEMQTWMAYD
ncbi:MAG: hypothetical protein ISR99_01995 [Parcubacteria group bacterium]|nr:hypothetical protein [Parcubacteria group bacterium]